MSLNPSSVFLCSHIKMLSSSADFCDLSLHCCVSPGLVDSLIVVLFLNCFLLPALSDHIHRNILKIISEDY